ncbi:ParA/MinD ATPase-like protein [Natronobacterium gregoryi SP2]|uniref:ParA/MinD ATPase-like protein n=3 Tax=Natronobacterium gregoryi TaxID=44930 RepID=L9XQM1_NATGS|nr:ParA/MinD ATPase-like protein [Natronobacterium gregoryi SP2]
MQRQFSPDENWTEYGSAVLADTMTRDQLWERLRAVEDPELDDDVVSLGLVTDVIVEGDTAVVSVAFNAPLSPTEREMCDEIRALCRGMGLTPRLHADSTHDGVTGVRNTITIGASAIDAKPGVVTGTLATALAGLDAHVGVFDFRLESASNGWLEAVDPPDLSGDPVVPATSQNVSVVRLGPLLPRDGTIPATDAVLDLLLPRIRNRLVWGGLDYLLVALPSSSESVRHTVLERVPTRGTIAVGAAGTESTSLRTAVRTLSTETTVIGALGTVSDGDRRPEPTSDYDLADHDLPCPYLGTIPLESDAGPDAEPFREAAVAITDLVGAINRQRAARLQLAEKEPG